MFCTDIPAPFLFFFSNTVPHLLYYSHLPTAMIALLLGLFVYFKNKAGNRLVSKLLLFIASAFFIWSMLDLILWTSIDSRWIMFAWSLVNLMEILVSASTLYFSYLFLEKKDAPFKFKILVGILLLVFIVLLPTRINIPGFDLTSCEAEQGPLIYYFYILEILFFSWLLLYLLKKITTSKGEEKKLVIYFSVGAFLFLSSFSGANLAASFVTFIDPLNTHGWQILNYGLFGMPIFMFFLAYLITRYGVFNIKLLGAQFLIISIFILIASQFAFIQNPTNKVLTTITLAIVSAFGWWLVRSVKVEVTQREQLAKLNINLQNLIKQRESLVHLVTHKVKGTFTRSKYIFAELLEGTFGALAPKMQNIVEQGLKSDNEGIATVDLVLNAANLQAGQVKYEMKPVDFKKITEEVIEDQKGPARAKGLKMAADIKAGSYNVLGDAIWLKEIAHNLVDNAVKYTLKGNIKVCLERKNDRLVFSVKDTGVGITDEDKKNLFKEGGRGKESTRVNVDSTGYGLYTIKLVAKAHQGKTWAESEGQDKGSTFYIELPCLA